MLRCTGTARDLSAESCEEVVYKNLREESPTSDIAMNGKLKSTKNTTCHAVNTQKNKQINLQNDIHNESQRSFDMHNERSEKYKLSVSAVPYHCTAFDTKRHSLGNGAMNGAATISYLWQRKDSAISLQSGNSVDSTTKPKSMKITRRKNSIGCLNSLSTSPKSPNCYYTISSSTTPTPTPTPSKCKSQSLPPHASINNLDPVIMSALRIPSDELANQLTLLDLPIFAAIQPDELTSCSWTNKEKHLVAPNIVKFTKRFNHTSFWTVQEILSEEHPKQRAEILTHFIKVAKKLHELNNLHSLYAVISAMQTASIYRLNKTWACISKKDKQSFDRLADIFSESKQFQNLREYLESLRLPCIPYLGIFLSDLIFIDTAHPYRGGLEPEQRRNKMNNILRVIANYQQSNYTQLVANEAVQKYLTSIRYIEELQNIFEEDQYKRSLKLEPLSASVQSFSSCSSKESLNLDAITPGLACLNISPAKTIDTLRVSNSVSKKFIPGHRKCRSLGTKFRSTSLPRRLYHKCQCSILMIAPGLGTISNQRCRCRIFGKLTYGDNVLGNMSCDLSNQRSSYTNGDTHYQRHQRHLLDDSVLECQHQHQPHVLSTLHIEKPTMKVKEIVSHLNETLKFPHMGNCIQGSVRRKTVQKEGRKAAMASWQRYWLEIWEDTLIYFAPKSFKGSDRSDFKREPCKMIHLAGWQAKVVGNTKHKNSFELFHLSMGTVYKFRTDSPHATHIWAHAICSAATECQRPKNQPDNLMSFE